MENADSEKFRLKVSPYSWLALISGCIGAISFFFYLFDVCPGDFYYSLAEKLFPLWGIVFGIAAKAQINQNRTHLTGNRLANIGIAISIIALFFVVFFPVF